LTGWVISPIIRVDQEGDEMTYSRASELLGLTTPKRLEKQAEMAKGMLSRMTYKTPLRYKVAADVLIRAAGASGKEPAK